MKKKSSITRNHIHPDDSGQLALDFIVGISIFMIAFIIVAAMTSGLLIGLQSREIDYDAVAYRTGVILVEDPGEIEERVGESHIAPDRYAWDLLYPEFWDDYHESNVMRMGLMLPRYYYDTPPRVLMVHKISEFFNQTKYDHDYYQDKIIFGDYPYRFNVTLTRLDNSVPVSIGDEIPADSPTGYIRRVILIKNSTGMDILDLFNENESGDITITYDLRKISEGEPAYMIYPSLERTTINFTNFTGPDTYNLTRFTFKLNGNQIQPFITQSPTILLRNHEDPLYFKRYPDDLGLSMPTNISLNNSSYFEIEPGFFTQRNFPSLGPVDVIDVTMTIQASNSSNTTRIGGNYDYYYLGLLPGITNFTQPALIPAVIEVRVW